jgi:hypothetical protein
MILCVLLLLPQAAPQKAGERYKSIQELREIPASEVIPVMSVIAGSLGVTCSHCHTDEFVSDEKPNKQKAREMIAMTRRIDAEFGGNGAVTCNTCHQGQAVPARVLLLEHAGWNRSALPPTAPLPTVDAVLDRYVNAVGGLAAIQKTTTRTFIGSVERFNGRSAAVTGTYRAAFTLPATVSSDASISYPPEANGELALVVARPARLRELYTRLEVTGRRRLGNTDTIVVVGTTTRGQHVLFFDEATGLLVRRTSERPTVLGPLPEAFDFDDYTDGAGMKVPKVITWSRPDYRVTFRLEKVE